MASSDERGQEGGSLVRDLEFDAFKAPMAFVGVV
jgi:hypothetical protein